MFTKLFIMKPFTRLNGCRIQPHISAMPYRKGDRLRASVEDMLFPSPSYAAMFVIGKSANGLTSWKTADGTAFRDLEIKEGTE